MVENVITSRLEIQGYENIKQIKDEITKLRQQMKELATGTEEYKETADQLVRTEYDLKQAMASQKNDNSSLVGSYNELVNQMGALKKVWRETTDEAVRADYGAQINALNTQLKQLDATTGNYQRNVGDYKNQLKQAKKELAQLTQGTAEYNAKLKECAEIQHNFQEQQTLIKNSAADFGDQLDNVVKIGSGMASGFAALNAAMGLFGKDTEDVQKALLKVQQTMALVQGLEGLDGMWKKCEQLSTALGLVRATTIQATTATAAEGVAMEGAAAAATAEAGATEGATVAQRGLNAAMKANPIGLVVAAVTALVAIFVALKDKFKDLIANNDEAAKKFNKLKEVFAGVGAVVKKWLILPIENTIDTFKTLGKVIGDVFTGKWGKIKEDLKEGAAEIKENVIDALDVKGTYAEAAAEKAEEIEREKNKKLAEESAKELENYIKDQESKSDADWKYTEDGIKKYREYYKKKMEMYDKDSEEYKQVQREMWSYEKALEDRKAANDKKLADEQKKQREKVVNDWKSMMKNLVSTTEEETKKEIEGLVEVWNKYVKQTKKGTEIDLGRDYIKGWDKLLKSIWTSSTEMTDDLRKEFIDALGDKAIDTLYKHQQELLVDLDNGFKAFYNNQKAAYDNSAIHNKKTLNDELAFEKAIYDEREQQYKESLIRLNLLEAELLQSAPESEREALKKQLEREFQPLIDLYTNELNNNETEFFKRQSEIRTQQMNNEIEATRNYIDEQKKLNQMVYDMYDSQASVWGEDSIKVFEVYRQMVDENYQYEVEGISNIIKSLEDALTSNMLTAEEYENTYAQLLQAQMELEDVELQHQIEVNNLKKESFKQTYDAIQSNINATSEVMGTFIDAYLKSIDTRRKADLISEKEAEKQYEATKGIQIAQAIINTIGAAMGAFNSMASIPYVGPVLGAAAAAATLATGYAQVEQIRNTNPYSSKNSGSNDIGNDISTTSTPSIDEYSPNRVTNITGSMETEYLKNAITSQPIWVSVSDIDRAQNRVQVKEAETTF